MRDKNFIENILSVLLCSIASIIAIVDRSSVCRASGGRQFPKWDVCSWTTGDGRGLRKCVRPSQPLKALRRRINYWIRISI